MRRRMCVQTLADMYCNAVYCNAVSISNVWRPDVWLRAAAGAVHSLLCVDTSS
jgi:hypothetical protein